MQWASGLWLRLKALFKRRQLDRDLDEELAFHLAMREQKLQGEGAGLANAHDAARRAFGNMAEVKETTRSLWTFERMETVGRDLRYGLRTLAKTPVLTAIVVVSLALGIGANTAIFSVVNAVMLRMLPVQEPTRLVLLNWSSKDWPEKVVEDIEGSGGKDPKTGTYSGYSLPSATFEYVRAHNDVFSSTVAFAANTEEVNVGLDGRADTAEVQGVSGDYFDGLGVRPLIGRTLLPSDDTDTAAPTAVVSHRYWIRKLGADRGVGGKQIVINGTPVTIVGVAPPEFFGIEPGSAVDIWIPQSLYATQSLHIDNYNLRAPKVWWLGVIGRLKPGVTPDQAHGRVSLLFRESLNAVGASPISEKDMPALTLVPAGRGLDSLREEFSTSLTLLMAMVGLVLLIACANVAGLLLARATVRQREIAVRLSLGASRARIIRQLLTESVLLAVLGGIAGLVVARWAREVLLALLASGRFPVVLSIQSDSRVLAFTAAISVVCGLLFGLAPALRSTTVEVLPVLKQAAGRTGSARHRFLSGKVLVGAQVALCLLLLICAGLLLGTLIRLQHAELGFDRENLVTFRVQPGLNGYRGERLARYYQQLQQRIGALPHVHAVGFSQTGVVGSGWSQGAAIIPGYTESLPGARAVPGVPGKRVPVWRHWIGPGFFGTLGIPVLQGRGIGPQDTAAAPFVAVVNRQVVEKYFHGDNPIGHIIDMNSGVSGKSGAEIVGVVADAKYGSLRAGPPPTAYFSYLQRKDPPTFMTFAVRTEGNPKAVIPAIQRVAFELDKDVPLIGVATEAEVIDQSLMMERTFAFLSSSFGSLALLLACVGLYGTISYTVAQRTNEIGIRMALGAAREHILGMVLRETLLVVAAGIGIGLPLSWAATRLLQAQLYGLTAHDPSAILVSTAVILVLAAIAGFLPARRAAHVDPMVALRYE